MALACIPFTGVQAVGRLEEPLRRRVLALTVGQQGLDLQGSCPQGHRHGVTTAFQQTHQPPSSFTRISPHVPEVFERRGQPEPCLLPPLQAAPLQCSPQVLQLHFQPFQPYFAFRPADTLHRLLGQAHVPFQVAVPHRCLFLSCYQLLARVLPHGLQEPVASTCLPALRDHERFGDQSRQEIQHLLRRHTVTGADGLRRLQRPATGEHGQPAQEQALRLAQQVIAPVQRRAERLLARQGSAATAGQQAKAVVEPRPQLVERQRRESCGCQLDGERQAIQPPADPRNYIRLTVGWHKPRTYHAGPLHKQLHRFAHHYRLRP